MMRMITQTKREAGTCLAAAHAANVDKVAGDEPHDPDSESEDDTTEPDLQYPNEQEESSHDADSNPSFR